ncbi:MAG: hypothetical protein U0893_22410 [Chloroflexota bacterium]
MTTRDANPADLAPPAPSSTSCPSCGAARRGQSAYCEQCGAELPVLETPSATNRGLVTALVVLWIVGLIWLLVWLTGHTLLLK